MQNRFFLQNNPIFGKNEQKVLPPIIKSIRHVQCCAMDELCYLMSCNLYPNEEEGLAFHFQAEISEEKNHNFLQTTIENQQKGHYFMSRSTPGTLCLRTQSAPGTLYLSTRVFEELLLLYLGSLSALGIKLKSALRAPGPQTKSTRCTPGHEITTLLLIFNC